MLDSDLSLWALVCEPRPIETQSLDHSMGVT